jgi:hypothetical protein
MEAKEIIKGIQIEKEAQNLSGSSHQGGGPKFESTSESRTSLPWTGHPGRVRTLFSMIHIWMESLFDKEANSSGPTSKDVRNQRESSKQVTIQNLSGRCVAVFWAIWAL